MMTERIIRAKEVSHLTGLSRAAIYNLMGKGSFPQSRKLGTRTTGWVESEVQEWITDFIARTQPEEAA